MSEMAHFLPGTSTAKAENNLLDFKSNWREFVIILTLDTCIVIKDDYESELTWDSNFAWRKFASTRTVLQPFWTQGSKT